MQVYKIRKNADAAYLSLEEAIKPEPGPGEVRIRVVATSLNYRDLLMLDNAVDWNLISRVPLSDGAGVVDAVGTGVTEWHAGDRVVMSYFRDWTSGRFRSEYMGSALGGPTADGVLAEYVVMPSTALVAVPPQLSLDQAATLPCAAVTAWHGLFVRGGLQAGDTILVQGTGGVALFALQLAVAAGARAIVLSSSDSKIERARTLGASDGINYRTTPEWQHAVRAATNGEGVSHVLELGGPETYARSLQSLAPTGHLIQIGVLTGFGPKPDLSLLQPLNADIHGIVVGSTAHLHDVSDFIAERNLPPVVDSIFRFDEAASALAYLRSGAHFGKIVLRVSP
ncbi:NAD(P)-dependent alcohol dehydrogenase [Rouxiella silvae]|uniref:NAD(P)-dependent alcohol dehydrogenase n=1 Tax=Rouxiella silvae TaxID=1646373 RepID=A0ABX3U271_9GAMM|nr:NAD(P)-dependent alcohol dehydrogenase [Rouxiella silvae]ORJ21599.1 NAD(P)-dependent alcohol dehydrogenase [Rouxiella silvae]